MKTIIFLAVALAGLFLITGCDISNSENALKKQELDLKARELDLKEKELAQKSPTLQQLSVLPQTNISDTNTPLATTLEPKVALPFVGRKLIAFVGGNAYGITISISNAGELMVRDQWKTYYKGKYMKNIPFKYDFPDGETSVRGVLSIDKHSATFLDKSGKVVYNELCGELNGPSNACIGTY